MLPASRRALLLGDASHDDRGQRSSNELLGPWPSPANLPTAPASAVWSRPPSSDASICDPFSMSEVWPPAPSMLARLPSELIGCFAASASFCAPPGCAATPLSPANSAGTAAPIADWTLLRSRPSAEAMRPIKSGVRNCMMSETRLVAMGFLLSVTELGANLSARMRARVAACCVSGAIVGHSPLNFAITFAQLSPVSSARFISRAVAVTHGSQAKSKLSETNWRGSDVSGTPITLLHFLQAIPCDAITLSFAPRDG